MNYYRELWSDGAIVTAEDVKNAYLGIEKQDTGQTLVGLVEEHNRITASVLKPGSLKNYFTTLTYLKNFLDKSYPGKDVLLRQLKYEFITGLSITSVHTIKIQRPMQKQWHHEAPRKAAQNGDLGSQK